jgi:hypothetical protein
MSELYLRVVGFDGQKIEISYSDVERLKGYVGVHTVTDSGFTYAGAEKRYVKIDTSTRSYDIPRSPENDAEVLEFMLRTGGLA